MRFLNAREAALALFTFALGIVTTGALHAAGHDPFQVVDGDDWLTSNANYNAGDWLSLNTTRPAFGLQLDERNDLPFDRGTASATFWVHNPGCSDAFNGFGNPCGWQLGLAVTQYRSVVVGGEGMEIDGLGAPAPYARIVNTTDAGSRLAGLLTNTYVDFSGVDSAAAPSWFSGFDLNHDAFALRRAAAGSRRFSDLLTVDRSGDAKVAGTFTTARTLQSAPNQWATRAQLVDGSYTFRYSKPFAQPPVCVATPEGTSHVHVTPAADACVVRSENPHDAAVVDIVVVGNPN
jgi:hypothetical protein